MNYSGSNTSVDSPARKRQSKSFTFHVACRCTRNCSFTSQLTNSLFCSQQVVSQKSCSWSPSILRICSSLFPWCLLRGAPSRDLWKSASQRSSKWPWFHGRLLRSPPGPAPSNGLSSSARIAAATGAGATSAPSHAAASAHARSAEWSAAAGRPEMVKSVDKMG